MLAKNEHLSINHFKAKAETEQERETKRNTHRTMYNGQTHNEIIKSLAQRHGHPTDTFV